MSVLQLFAACVAIWGSTWLAITFQLGSVAPEASVFYRFLLASADQGRVIREGVKAVIVGRPNVGKSSLLNQLLREERALVTETPGTTRDTIEELIAVRGIPVHLVDTAGIRDHQDAVEELGIERARRKMREADLVLFVVDASRGLSAIDKELYASLEDRKRVAVLNKKDIADQRSVQELSSFFSAVPQVRTAAKGGEGIPELRDTIYQVIIGEEKEMSERISCAPNLRHKMILEKTLTACAQAKQTLSMGGPADLLAVDLRLALDYLADIVGLTTPDDVLDVLFTRFCIGK